MQYSPMFGELLFNLFYTVIFIIFSSINIYFYNEIKSKPSTAISNNEAESMFVTSIVLLCIALIVLIYFLYRLFTHTTKIESVPDRGVIVKKSMDRRTTLDRYDILPVDERKKQTQFFDQVKTPRNANFDLDQNIDFNSNDQARITAPKRGIIGEGF